MKIREHIKENRQAIDAHIERATNGKHRYKNDEERRLWILNDETLYNQARAAGVDI